MYHTHPSFLCWKGLETKINHVAINATSTELGSINITKKEQTS